LCLFFFRDLPGRGLLRDSIARAPRFCCCRLRGAFPFFSPPRPSFFFLSRVFHQGTHLLGYPIPFDKFEGGGAFFFFFFPLRAMTEWFFLFFRLIGPFTFGRFPIVFFCPKVITRGRPRSLHEITPPFFSDLGGSFFRLSLLTPGCEGERKLLGFKSPVGFFGSFLRWLFQGRASLGV